MKNLVELNCKRCGGSLKKIYTGYICRYCGRSFSEEDNVAPVIINGCVIENGVVTEYVGKERYVTIPDGIREIGEKAFYKCGYISDLIVSDSVKKIGKEAFYGCYNLKNVFLPDGIENISEFAFSCCDKLVKNRYDRANYLGSRSNPYLYLEKAVSLSIEQCVIHEQTRIIGAFAFSENRRLKSITIPRSVRSIETMAFHNSGLKSIEFPSSIKYIGRAAFECCRDLTSVRGFPITLLDSDHYKDTRADRDDYIVNPSKDDSCVLICQSAFSNCEELTDVELIGFGGNIAIGQFAFSNCKKLEKVRLVNVFAIDRNAFSECFNLRLVDIDCGLLSLHGIGEYAFEGCRRLEKIIIPDGVAILEWNAFSGCKKLRIYIDFPTDTERWCKGWNSGRPVFDLNTGKRIRAKSLPGH